MHEHAVTMAQYESPSPWKAVYASNVIILVIECHSVMRSEIACMSCGEKLFLKCCSLVDAFCSKRLFVFILLFYSASSGTVNLKRQLCMDVVQ